MFSFFWRVRTIIHGKNPWDLPKVELPHEHKSFFFFNLFLAWMYHASFNGNIREHQVSKNTAVYRLKEVPDPFGGKGKKAFPGKWAMCQCSETPWHRQMVIIIIQKGIFFPSFRNHTIAQSQQLARLRVSNATMWSLQALDQQKWQCFHRGSSRRAAEDGYHRQVSLHLTARWSSLSQPSQPNIPCWIMKVSKHHKVQLTHHCRCSCVDQTNSEPWGLILADIMLKWTMHFYYFSILQ